MHKNETNMSLLVLLVGASVLLFFVYAPFLPVLSLAAVFAILLHQPYERLTKRFKGWQSFAALLTVGLTLILFIVPLFFLGIQVFHEAQTIYANTQSNGAEYLHAMQSAIERPIQRIFPGLSIDLQAYVGSTLVFISNNLGSLAYQTIFVVIDTSLMLLALFFFLRDGRSLLKVLVEISPLGQGVTIGILNKMYQTIGSVVNGTVVNALIRWLCIWAAFYLFGIPNAILWSSIGGIIGAIPGLGTPFSFAGAVVYLFVGGNSWAALGLALVGVVVVILVDNILTSYFFGKGLEVSPIFVLFSILGGVIFFGPFGFILGPLVLSVFLSVIRAYESMEHKTPV